MKDTLNNPKAYSIFKDIVNGGKLEVTTSYLNNMNNLHDATSSVINILLDGIEHEEVQNYKIKIKFENNFDCELSMVDAFFNFILWGGIVRCGGTIEPYHIFFEKDISPGTLKDYVDNYIILPYKQNIPNIVMNNIIADTLDVFKVIDHFSAFLCNTINLEDDLVLLLNNPELRKYYNRDLSNCDIEEVVNEGAKYVGLIAEKLMESEHGLKDMIRAKQGANLKQYQEYAVNIGTKPDGRGSIYPYIVNTSFLEGIHDVESAFTEATSSRIAQILSKNNVGGSGHMARLIGLNNSESKLHPDEKYICDSVNFTNIFIANKDILERLSLLYYKESFNGVDKLIDHNDMSLIGKNILLRTPMTCASYSRGEGICYRCYGELAYTNRDINIGKISAEILSAQLTQRLLSAKHLLRSDVEPLNYSENFLEYFEVDLNIVIIKDPSITPRHELVFNIHDITFEEEDALDNSALVDRFYIKERGSEELIEMTCSSELYITDELFELIKNAKPVDDFVHIQFNKIAAEDVEVCFLINIKNNELSKTLDEIKSLIDKKDVTQSHDRHTILQRMIELVIEGGLAVNAIHCAVILSNQLRSGEDILETPEWEYYNSSYQLLPLKIALNKNPSITISLSFQDIARQLVNPLTYMKKKSSLMDLYYMEQPLQDRPVKSDPSCPYDIEERLSKYDKS